MSAGTSGAGPPEAPDTVFFLSDYGLRDEFVGVVHAVLRRLAPRVRVIDLTHEVPPFDVRAGAGALTRALPHLGPGVVLAVVDPGVGGGRRGLLLEVAAARGPRYLVGPDNGLLVPAAEAAGGVRAALELAEPPPGSAATFDGRDVFAPVAAALCQGSRASELGTAVDPASLERVPALVVEPGILPDGRHGLRAEVSWVDRFGNVQLAAPASALPAGVPWLVVHPEPGPWTALMGAELAGDEAVVRVRTFADLEPDQPGLLVDGNGNLALVVREGSAAAHFGIGPGSLVQLVW